MYPCILWHYLNKFHNNSQKSLPVFINNECHKFAIYLHFNFSIFVIIQKILLYLKARIFQFKNHCSLRNMFSLSVKEQIFYLLIFSTLRIWFEKSQQKFIFREKFFLCSFPTDLCTCNTAPVF